MQNNVYNKYNSNPEMLAAAQQYGLIATTESQKPYQNQNTQAKINSKQVLQQYQSIQSISEAPEREESSALHLDEDRFNSYRFQPQIYKAEQMNAISESGEQQQYQQQHQKHQQVSYQNQSLKNKEQNQIQTTIDQVQELIRATQDRISSSERTSQRISVQTDRLFSEGGQSVEDRNSSKLSYQESQQLNGLQSLNNKINSNLQNFQTEQDKMLQQSKQLNYTGERIVYEEPPQPKDSPHEKKENQNNYNNNNMADIQFKNSQPLTELVIADKQEYIPLSMQIMLQINGRQEQQPRKQEKEVQKEYSPIQKDHFNQQQLIEKQKQLVLKRYQEGIKKTQIQNKYFDHGTQPTEKLIIQSSNGSKQQKSPKNQNQAKNNDQIRLGTSPDKIFNSVANPGDQIDSAVEIVNPKHVQLSLDQFKMKSLHNQQNNDLLKSKNAVLQPTKKPHSAGNTAINKEPNTFMSKIQKFTGNSTSIIKKGSSYQNGSSLDLIRKMMLQKDFKALQVPEENIQSCYQPQPNARESMPTHLEGIEVESSEIKERETDLKQSNKMQNLDQEMSISNQTVEVLKNIKKDGVIATAPLAPSNQPIKQLGSIGGKHHIQMSQDSLIRSLEERKKFTFASNGEKCLIFTKETTPIISNRSAQTTKRALSKDQAPQNDLPSQDQIIPYSEYYEDPMRQSEILLLEEQEAFQELERQKGMEKLKFIDQTNNALKNEVQDSQYYLHQKSILKQSNDSVNSQQGFQQLQSYQPSEMHSPKNPDNYQYKQGQKTNYGLGIGGIAMYESGEHNQSNYQMRQSPEMNQNHLQNSKSSQNIHNTNLSKPRAAEPKISKLNQPEAMIMGSISPQQNVNSGQKDLRWLDYSALDRNNLWLQVRNQNRSNLQKQLQQKELAQCTFKPTINTLHNKRNNILPSGFSQNNDISVPFLNNTNTTLNITNNLTANYISNSQQNYQQKYSPNGLLKNDRSILNQSKNLSISTNHQGPSFQHNYAQSTNNIPGNSIQTGNNNNNSNNRSYSSNVNSATNRSALAQSNQQNRMNQSRDKSILQKSISPSQSSMLGGQSSFQSPNQMNKKLQNTKSYSEISKIKRQSNNNIPPAKSSNILRSPGVFSSPTLLYPPQKIISSKIESNILNVFAKRQAKFI